MEPLATIIRCVIYLRVSLDATGDQLAVSRQREDCMAIAAARGWKVVAEFTDNSIGAYSKTKVRPAYDRMVAAYEAGQFDALVCWDLDRLTRIPRQLEDWIDKAEDRGLLLVTANGEADLTNDNGRLFARIKASVARAESERKAARQKRALRQRAESGLPALGVRPIGYTTSGEIIEAEAGAIQEAFRRFHEGDSLYGIALWLDQEGVPTRRGGRWNPSTVRTILTNPRYAGRSYYNRRRDKQSGTWAPGTWPPLVEDWLFDIVQDMLADPQRRSGAGGDRRHLGSGLYLCGVCGGRVRSNGCGRYRCPEVGHVTRKGGPVDELVALAVCDALAAPDAREAFEPETRHARQAAEEIRRLRGRLRQAELDYDSDLIDGARYKAKRDKITAELDAAEAARAGATGGLDVTRRLTAGAPDAAAVRRGWDELPLGSKRAVISALMTVRLAKAPRGPHFDPASVLVEWRQS